MGGGICRYFFEKQSDINFADYIVDKLMKENGFSFSSHYSDYAILFDGAGEEFTCYENEFDDLMNRIGNNFLITLWKNSLSASIYIDMSDSKYDIFDLILDGLNLDECNQLIRSISILILKSRRNLQGILIDRRGDLIELCYRHNDNQYLDFVFNNGSDVRKESAQIYTYKTGICDRLELYTLNDKNSNSIYVYNFLPDGKIETSIFEL